MESPTVGDSILESSALPNAADGQESQGAAMVDLGLQADQHMADPEGELQLTVSPAAEAVMLSHAAPAQQTLNLEAAGGVLTQRVVVTTGEPATAALSAHTSPAPVQGLL
jgi:hypothetical protein